MIPMSQHTESSVTDACVTTHELSLLMRDLVKGCGDAGASPNTKRGRGGDAASLGAVGHKSVCVSTHTPSGRLCFLWSISKEGLRGLSGHRRGER